MKYLLNIIKYLLHLNSISSEITHGTLLSVKVKILMQMIKECYSNNSPDMCVCTISVICPPPPPVNCFKFCHFRSDGQLFAFIYQ